MFVTQLKSVVTLAVQWNGNNLEEMEDLFDSVRQKYDNSLMIEDRNSEGIKVPLNWFVVKYSGTLLVLDEYEFCSLCRDYFNPHERHPTEEGFQEVEDNRPDMDFITFM